MAIRALAAASSSPFRRGADKKMKLLKNLRGKGQFPAIGGNVAVAACCIMMGGGRKGW